MVTINGNYLYLVDILVSGVPMHLYCITYKRIYNSCYTHLKTHTNSGENAYKLCKISYKARKCIYTYTKIHNT